MRVRVAAWSSTCIFLVAGCTPGNTSANPSGDHPTAVVQYSSAALGSVAWSNASCGRPAAKPTAGPAPSRVSIPNHGGFGGLAVDGNGTAWFGGQKSIFCYSAGHPLEEFPLDWGTQPSSLRSAPDGSVWFADRDNGRLGRIDTNAVLTERYVGAGTYVPYSFTGYPNSVAIGPDGSVWFDVGSLQSEVARMRPDGTLTTYPIASDRSLTVDSHGNAWIPSGAGKVVRISDSGDVSQFKVDASIEQLVEAPDGRMWFFNQACLPVQQIGWIDGSGRTQMIEVAIADDSAYPNALVRAPDGALWFSTVDGRLIRLASETDVTAYSLPWSDLRIGPFSVLPGNHILMIGRGEVVNSVEQRHVLDFVAVNGIRVAGPGAIPPPPHVAKDAAEAVAYPLAAQATSARARIALYQSWEGSHAALFSYNISDGGCSSSTVFVYVIEDSAGWHKYDVFPSGPYQLPQPNLVVQLKFQSGCVNVHQSPSLGSQVVSCLGSGTSANIDQGPVYADGNIWWHLTSIDGRLAPVGWAVQEYLLCSDYFIGRLPQC